MFAISSPTISEHFSKLIFSSCSPCSAFVEGVKIGLPKSFYLENLNSDIEKLFHDAVNVLEGLGAEVVEIDVPGASELQAWATILIYSDAGAFHHDRLKNSKEKKISF